MPTPNPLDSDLEAVLKQTQGLWEDVRGQRLFITGGTGFFGFWLLRSLLYADAHLGLGLDVLLLSRDPGSFARTDPEVSGHPAVTLIKGDVRSFKFPKGEFSHVIHMATETNSSLSDPSAAEYFDTSTVGTAHVLRFARTHGTRRLLLTSSGAIYGAQPEECERIPETCRSAPPPEDIREGYAHGKRAAEFLCAAAADATGLAATIARCFAFAGPGLPLDSGFAVGNFIRDALFDDHIMVKGDGTPLRSYLYASDLSAWLWTILFRGAVARPYNVGSEAAVDVLSLARLVGTASGRDLPIRVAQPPAPRGARDRYVPDTTRARTELGLTQTVELSDGIERTLRWHRSTGPKGVHPA